MVIVKVVSGAAPKVDLDSKTDKGSPRHDRLRSGLVDTDTSRLPMLELMSMSLDTWGTKTIRSSGESPPEAIVVDGDGHVESAVSQVEQSVPQVLSGSRGSGNPLAQVPLSMMNLFDPRTVQTRPLDEALNFNLISQAEPHATKPLLTMIVLVVVILLLAYCVSCLCYDTSESPELQKHSPTKAESQTAWARAFQEAQGEEKEAFELLFRCNIVSTEEFACNTIDQEHIQECIWIATHMLHHKPLEEWVELWQGAQRGFEERVAECFEAKGGQVGLTARALAQRLKNSRSQYMSPSSPSAPTSMPSSANLDFVSADPNLDLRPLQS